MELVGRERGVEGGDLAGGESCAQGREVERRRGGGGGRAGGAAGVGRPGVAGLRAGRGDEGVVAGEGELEGAGGVEGERAFEADVDELGGVVGVDVEAGGGGETETETTSGGAVGVVLADVPRQSPYNKGAMSWHLMTILPTLLGRPAFAPLAAYLGGSDGAAPEQVRLWQLCQKVADLFDQYLVYRPDWIARWEEGEGLSQELAGVSGQDWQPELWRELVDILERRMKRWVAVVTARDRRTRDEVIEAAIVAESRSRALLSQASETVFILEADYSVRSASAAVERVLGYAPEDLIGTDASRFMHPDDLPRVREAFDHAVAAPGGSAQVTYRRRTAAGDWSWAEATITHQLDDPVVAGVVANVRDVDERERALASVVEDRKSVV